MSVYTVTAVNNSTTPWTFFIYQPPISGNLTLAWLASQHPIPSGGGITQFPWQTNYQFVWAATGFIQPGKVVKPAAKKDCDPQDANTTTFTFQGPIPVFSEPVPGATKGTLCIFDGSNIPPDTYAVGVGLSGNATYVENAGPGFRHALTPPTTYYIAAISVVEQGQVLDIRTITQSAKIPFSPGVYSITATLQADNLWTFTSGPPRVVKGAKVK